jgi:hypothetical protein
MSSKISSDQRRLDRGPLPAIGFNLSRPVLFHQPAPVGDFFWTLPGLPSAIPGFLTGSVTVTPYVQLYATGGGGMHNVDLLEPENAIISATANSPRACVPARHSQNAQVVMLGINLRFSAR